MSRAETEGVASTLPLLSVGVSAVGVLAVAGAVAPTPVPLAAAVFGGAFVAVGLVRFEDWWLTVGAATLFGALVLDGPRSTEWFLGASVPVVLTWTNARYALRLGRQVGRAGDTGRVELVHAVLTVTVLAVGGGFGYVVSRSVRGSGSLLSVGLLFVAVVLFTLALQRT